MIFEFLLRPKKESPVPALNATSPALISTLPVNPAFLPPIVNLPEPSFVKVLNSPSAPVPFVFKPSDKDELTPSLTVKLTSAPFARVISFAPSLSLLPENLESVMFKSTAE